MYKRPFCSGQSTIRALRALHSSPARRFIPMNLPFDMPGNEDETKDNRGREKNTRNKPWTQGKWMSAMTKAAETTGVMVVSLAMLGLAGLGYHSWYQYNAERKIMAAFARGDPTFQLCVHNESENTELSDWVEREHQSLLDNIFNGATTGRYYLLIGEKGTGKTSMILESMSKVDGINCVFMDAHADPEIFRIRLGKALDFEFHEDYLGSLFSIRGPRDTTAVLDIERAFNKLEKVALKHHTRTGNPLIMVINNAHLLVRGEDEDDQSKHLIQLLQQKAESLSGAGLVTIVFNSDDYWLYERLKKLATKLEVITVNDLTRLQTRRALRRARRRFNGEVISDGQADMVYNLIGGRPQHIAAVAHRADMVEACHKLIDKEKTWFLNQCGLLGEDMDDDVMESGKFSTSAMFLVREMVKIDREQRLDRLTPEELAVADHEVPRLPLWRARQIMTRPDYIQRYDDLNLFTLDSNSLVKADSVPMMQAFREIASEPGFNEFLEETADRVSAIESLGRTRELVAKDLVLGGKYRLGVDENKVTRKKDLIVSLDSAEEEDEAGDGEEGGNEIDDDGFNYLNNQRKKVWVHRLDRYRGVQVGGTEALIEC